MAETNGNKITIKTVMVVLSLVAGGGGGGYILRDVQTTVHGTQDLLVAHNQGTTLAIRDIDRDRQDARDLHKAIADLVKTVDRLAVLMEKRGG